MCSFQNGTLCNANMGNYPVSLELKSQPVSKLQCYICVTNDSENCLEPKEKFISDCPDISYDCCYIRKGSSTNKLNSFFEVTLEIPKRQKESSSKRFHIERGCGRSTDKISINDSVCSNNNCNSARIDHNSFVNATAINTTEVITAAIPTTEAMNSLSSVGDNVTGSEFRVKLSFIFMTGCIYILLN